MCSEILSSSSPKCMYVFRFVFDTFAYYKVLYYLFLFLEIGPYVDHVTPNLLCRLKLQFLQSWSL